MKSILISILFICLILISCKTKKDHPRISAQESAIRSMDSLIKKKQLSELYLKWCHPHLAEQLSEANFIIYMNSTKGEKIGQLFTDVIAAIDNNAGKDILISQMQNDEKAPSYEYILTKLKHNKIGFQWHLELQEENGIWKLMDTD